MEDGSPLRMVERGRAVKETKEKQTDCGPSHCLKTQSPTQRPEMAYCLKKLFLGQFVKTKENSIFFVWAIKSHEKIVHKTKRSYSYSKLLHLYTFLYFVSFSHFWGVVKKWCSNTCYRHIKKKFLKKLLMTHILAETCRSYIVVQFQIYDKRIKKSMLERGPWFFRKGDRPRRTLAYPKPTW